MRPSLLLQGGIHVLRARACSAACPDRKPASHPDHCRHARGRGKTQTLTKAEATEDRVVHWLGPKKRHYVIDHHHLSLALHKEGLRDVLVTVVLDLSALNLDAFWTVLDHKSLVYPFDAQGRRRDFADIPKTVMQLKDDPFRSLAGELRRAGGFAKDTTPFSEFLWADFFRRKIKRKAVEADFSAAMERALRLARSEEAEYLPGWCGPKAYA